MSEQQHHSVDELIDIAGRTPLFGMMPRASRQRILDLGEHMHFDAGETIIDQGEEGSTAYILLSGQVRVSRKGQQVIDLEPGAVFGELSLIDGGARSASVFARTEVTALMLNHETLWSVLRDEPSVMEQVLREMTRRLREYERPIDQLTGMPNRAMFEELLGMSLELAERDGSAVAVVSLGLDGFRLVNEALGSVGGDRVLQMVADRLRDTVPGTVARAGNDEFLALITDTQRELRGVADEEDVFDLADAVVSDIHRALAEPFIVDGREVTLSVSAGFAVYPAFSEDPMTVLRDSVAAMNESKKGGPGGHLVSTKGSGDAVGRLQLVNEVRHAAEMESWALLFQPIVDLSNGEMIAVEALIRWRKDGKLIPPGVFLPMAEDLGLIAVIGDWVMRETCRQSQAWRDEGLDLKISFNLSPKELSNPKLVERLVGLVDKHQIPKGKLVVEIVETSAETDPEATQKVLTDLAARGIAISIDDFGTGYSSLSRLKDMPVSTLKIDRSFVIELPQDDAANVVRAVVGLSDTLSMTSLAEGIETEEQRDTLKSLGCQLGQGYLFGKPLDPAVILEVSRRDNKPFGEG